MKAITLAFVAIAFACATSARGQDERLVITRAAMRPSLVATAEHFTGTVHVQPLFDSTAMARAFAASVSFNPGARTDWHAHPRGQILIVTAGVGRVQLWSGTIREIRAGDVVRIPPGVKHWHGAAPATAMTHIAVVEYFDGRNTEWMEKVSDAQYRAPIDPR